MGVSWGPPQFLVPDTAIIYDAATSEVEIYPDGGIKVVNMAYCRFRSTEIDMEDCRNHLYDDLSAAEHRARKRLIIMCKDIADEVSDEDWLLEDNPLDE